MMKKFILGAVVLFAASTVSATALQTPSSVKFKIHQFWVSTSPLCTSPTRVYAPSTPTYQELTSGTAVLGTGAVAPGTYNCVIIVMSDQIKATASATGGAHCVSGTEYTKDLCHTGDPSVNVDGTTLNCTDATEDLMTIYISTVSPAGTGNPLAPPTTLVGDTKGEKLVNPLVVTTTGAGTAVFDVTNGLDGDASTCSLENISFSFRN